MKRAALVALALTLFGMQVTPAYAMEGFGPVDAGRSGYEEVGSADPDATESIESGESESEESTEPEESEPEESEPEESEPEESEPEESEPEESEPEESEPEESEPEESEPEESTEPEESEPEESTEPEESEPGESTEPEDSLNCTAPDDAQETAYDFSKTYVPYEGAKYSLLYYSNDEYASIHSYAVNGDGENLGDLIIPNEIDGIPVKKIESRAFSGGRAFNGTLTLPDSVDWIGQSAFAGCTGLSGTLKLPDSLTGMGGSAFMNCSGLTGTLKLPSALTSVPESCFYGCSGLGGDLILSDNITSIGRQAFGQCTGLDGNLKLPGGLTSMGNSAFAGCSGLKGSLTIPESLTEIPISAFLGCSGFNGSLTLPDSITKIDQSAFNGCNGFSGSLTIPAGLSSVGISAFQDCSGFNGSLVLPEGLKGIGESAFRGCSGFSGDLRLPDSLEGIYKDAFEGCSGFDGSLTLPKGLSYIGERAFMDCSGLRGNLILPGTLKMEDNAFYGCSGFDGSLIISRGMTELASGAFGDCEGFLNISIPGSVTTIHDYAFWNCAGVSDIYFEGNQTQWDSMGINSGNENLVNGRVHCGTYYSADNMPPASGNYDNPVAVLKPSGSAAPILSDRSESQAYRTYGETVNSYLYDNGNGLTRVEFCDGKVVIENYDAGFHYQNGWTLDPELPLWGGFYAGEKYNFLIFGQNNPNEDNATEVIRVVKYDKSWNRLNHASLKGANTVAPFDFGSLRCDEYGDMLYVHTCHEMYKSSDGLNHQANLTFSVRQTDMWITDQISEVSNASRGYVSHSFNQFVLTDREGNLVTLDHGDAYPRSAVLIRYNTKAGRNNFSGKGASAVNLFEFPGQTGDNNTNASVGGLAETGAGYIAAYNYSPDSNYEGIRNIYISYLPKDSFAGGSVRTWSSEVAAGTTPVVAAAGADGGYVLWRNKNVTDGVQYVHYDAQGNISLVRSCGKVLLSDCQPILFQGNMVWYVSNQSGLKFYTLSESGISVYDTAGSKQPTPDQQNPDQVRSFVSRMYTVVLGRDAEPQGLNDWSNRLLAHTVDGAGIADGFILSDEFKQKNVPDETYVDILYRAFFDRAPDQEGRNNWLSVLANGNSREYVLAGFVNSVEFDNLCGKFGIIRGTMTVNEKGIGPGVRQFVNRCYVKVLERQGEPAGVSDWISRIARGEQTPESTAKEFFFSQEYNEKNTSDEQFVETLYQTFMDRPSDPPGKSDWLGRLSAGASRSEVLEGFSRSKEFEEILRSFGL